MKTSQGNSEKQPEAAPNFIFQMLMLLLLATSMPNIGRLQTQVRRWIETIKSDETAILKYW